MEINCDESVYMCELVFIRLKKLFLSKDASLFFTKECVAKTIAYCRCSETSIYLLTFHVHVLKLLKFFVHYLYVLIGKRF